MHIERMKYLQEKLTELVEEQDVRCANAKQFGEVVDMIKDLSEAIYYSVITKSMEEAEEKPEGSQVRTVNYYSPMYYPNGGNGGGNSGGQSGGSQGGGTRYYTPKMPDEYMNYGMMPDDGGYYRRWEIAERNPMEGKSPIRRRMYMEGKQQHRDMPSQLHELEAYLQELSSDMTEMMKDASPEEKNTLRQKMNNIINKLA